MSSFLCSQSPLFLRQASKRFNTYCLLYFSFSVALKYDIVQYFRRVQNVTEVSLVLISPSLIDPSSSINFFKNPLYYLNFLKISVSLRDSIYCICDPNTFMIEAYFTLCSITLVYSWKALASSDCLLRILLYSSYCSQDSLSSYDSIYFSDNSRQPDFYFNFISS